MKMLGIKIPHRLFGLTILLASTIQLIGQSTSEEMFMNSSRVEYYAWGEGHVSEEIWIHKDTNLFRHSYRDDLWMAVSSGTYSIKDDTLFLKCITDCDIGQQKQIPIVVPVYSCKDKGGIQFYSTTYLPRYDYDGKLVNIIDKGKNVTSVLNITKDGDLKFSIPVEKGVYCFKVYFNHKFNSYSLKEGFLKIFTINQSSISSDETIYSKVEIPVNENIPKRRRRKK